MALIWKYLKSGVRAEEAAAIIGKPLWKHYKALTFIDDPPAEMLLIVTLFHLNKHLARLSRKGQQYCFTGSKWCHYSQKR